MTAPRDEELLLVDAYVDALLSRHEMLVVAGTGTPTAVTPPTPALADPRLSAAARELHTSLVRFHPSFRFEDRLAGRLRAAAQGQSEAPMSPVADGSPVGAMVIPFPGSDVPRPIPSDPERGHGLLLGGAIASGVSIAGAALYAWRRQHGVREGPADRSLGRAARAAHRLSGSGGRGSVIVAARVGGRLAARRQREGLA